MITIDTPVEIQDTGGWVGERERGALITIDTPVEIQDTGGWVERERERERLGFDNDRHTSRDTGHRRVGWRERERDGALITIDTPVEIQDTGGWVGERERERDGALITIDTPVEIQDTGGWVEREREGERRGFDNDRHTSRDTGHRRVGLERERERDGALITIDTPVEIQDTGGWVGERERETGL